MNRTVETSGSRLTDTHAHLYEPEYDADREEVLARARAAGVVRMLLPAIDGASHERLFDLARRHPESCTPMMGLHPTSVNDNPRWRDDVARAERLLRQPPPGLRFCAVGEIGLDFYWSAEDREAQIEAFRLQVDLALELGLPIAVHTRDAWPEMRAVIRSYAGKGLRGVFHAFADSIETYRELRAAGDFLFGIGGVVTFRNSTLSQTVAEMSLDDIVLETDCPYLTPAPHRGRRNEPAYVRYICEKVAQIQGLSPEEVAAATERNAERLFGPGGDDAPYNLLP